MGDTGENYLAVNLGGSQWVLYEELLKVVTAAVNNREPGSFQDLEIALRTYRRDFLTLLKNPIKKPESRESVKKATTEGIRVIGYYGTKVLTQSQVDEALIISDLFDLNEIAALELLLLAESQQSRLGAKTRGLAAVVLYYSGRQSLATALRILIQARSGRSWTLGASNEITNLITRFTDDLWSEGLADQIFWNLESFKLDKEQEKLEEKRALGDAKHRKQVFDILEDIQTALAECLYCWSCQCGLERSYTTRLFNILTGITPSRGDGNLDSMQIALLMASLYSIDLTSLTSADESDELWQRFPLIADEHFVPSLHKEILSPKQWKCPGLKAIIQFAWGISLRTLSQLPVIQGSRRQQCVDDDEAVVELSLESNTLNSLSTIVIGNPSFFKEEFFVRRIHGIVTDFIVNMPLTIKELRNRGDEVAKIVAHSDPTLNQSSVPPLYFSMFMDLVCRLYAQDPLELHLNSEYWCPTEFPFQMHRPSPIVAHPSQKQVNLYKFILLAGEFLPPTLYIPYIKMLTSLSSSSTAANHCFHLLKHTASTGGAQYSIVSWDHFFGSFQRYAASLLNESSTDGVVHSRTTANTIAPQEIEGLIAVLNLIETVALNDEVARSTFCENSEWNPLTTFLALVCCAVPLNFKGQIVSVLASLVRNSYVAVSLWQHLDNSGILPSHGDGGKSSIQMELEEMESHWEIYCLTRSFLKLLSVFVDTFHNLDVSGQEVNARFDCCVVYVINSVISKFHLRSYKSQEEKWQVASLCLEFLLKLVNRYQPDLDYFGDRGLSEHRGYLSSGQLIVTNMLQSSLLLKTILNIIDDVTRIYDQMITSFPGKPEIETCSLLCLKLILKVLEIQEAFMTYVRDKKLSVLVVGLDQLLMGINPRSNLADHLLRISKFINYNRILPEHANYAVKIMSYMWLSPSLHPAVVGTFTTNKDELDQFRQGIVECLEVDDVEMESNDTSVLDESQCRCAIREGILRMLIQSINHPKPNMALYLLGFDCKKSLIHITLQDAGVMGSLQSCLHSILDMISQKNSSQFYPVTSELCQHLIYQMCCHSAISGPTMRYLRSSHEFFEHQLKLIPYAAQNSDRTFVATSMLNRLAWLLKTVAIELRVAAVGGQRSNLHRLLSLLVDNKTVTEIIEPNRLRPKLLSVVDDLQLSQTLPAVPQWEYFDSAAVEKIISFCQRPTPSGFTAVDIRVLHKLLSVEVKGLHGSLTLGQQSLVNKEIQLILEYVAQRNQYQLYAHSKRNALEAWRHITETVVATMTDDFLDRHRRVTIILELIHHFLQKISDDTTIPELVNPSTTVLTTLFSSLRQCFVNAKDFCWKVYSSSLEVALHGLINCILNSGGGPYKVRANYYSALLSLLRIGCNLPRPNIMLDGLDDNDEDEKFLNSNLEVISSYGQDLFEILCHDMCSTNDLAKMLALSCLSALVSGDRNELLLKFLASHGYVKECVNSLLKDDDALSSLPIYRTDNLRKLYVYEAKMTFFIHLSCTTQGAKLMVFSRLLQVLADMRAFDNYLSNPAGMSVIAVETENSPWCDAAIAFHQILVPALKICQLLLSSTSGVLLETRLQVSNFLISHIETFSGILRKTEPSEHDLQEQTLLCAVLTKVLVGDAAVEEETDMESATQLSRLQRLCQSLFAALISKRSSAVDVAGISPASDTVDGLNEIIMWNTNIVSLLSFFVSRIGPSGKPQITFGPILKIGNQPLSFPEYQSTNKRNTRQLLDLGLLVWIVKYTTVNYLTLVKSQSQVDAFTSQHSIWNPRIENVQNVPSENPLKRRQMRLILAILEKTMYLLWCHLDFYLIQSVALKPTLDTSLEIVSTMRRLQDFDRRGSSSPRVPASSSTWTPLPIDKEELKRFKTDCEAVLNESLLGRVTEVVKTMSDTKEGQFLAVMTRRIKWIIQNPLK